MKFLVIMGSLRKGNTDRAAERIREIHQSYGPVEFEYFLAAGGEPRVLPRMFCLHITG